jgi:SAM-dependent methyltransferase
MTLSEAADLIRPALKPGAETWADIGAGSGLFAQALQSLLPKGRVYALDKSPHLLWSLPPHPSVRLTVEEADFTRPFELPEPLDGMIMANALHYAPDPAEALRQVLRHLRPGGSFLLIEYDTARPKPPWVPYPVPLDRFQALAAKLGLGEPELIARRPSHYGAYDLYSAVAQRS